MNNRIKSLDNTKWILNLLICLYHIQFMGDEKYSTLFYWVKDLGNCVVQVFSLISGFLFFRNIRNLDNTSTPKHKIIEYIASSKYYPLLH